MADIAGYAPLPADAKLDAPSPDGYAPLPNTANLDAPTLLDTALNEGVGAAVQSIPQRVADWWNDTGNASHVVTPEGQRLLKWTPAGMQAVKDQGGSIRDVLMANPLTGVAPGEGLARSAISMDAGAAISPVQQAAASARQAGYVFPPQMVGEGGPVSNIASGLGGKVKLQQAASAKNQEVTNALAAKSIGVPEDTPLMPKTFSDVRTQAGQAYDPIRNSGITLTPDTQFNGEISTLGDSSGAQAFPGIVKNKEIDDLKTSLLGTPSFSPDAAIDAVQQLRKDSSSNLANMADPAKRRLGFAQKGAADALDDLVERNLAAAGHPELVPQYRDARTLIAKSYDLQKATNPATGEVNAQKLASMYSKGRPFTDELQTIANTASAFPKAMQAPAGFGGEEEHSVLGIGGAALAAAHGHPEILGAILGRPVVRRYLLSSMMQPGLKAPQPALGGSPALAGLLQGMAVRPGILNGPGTPNAGLLGAY